MLKAQAEKAIQFTDEININTYRTLMTRGQKGSFVYCTDSNLVGYLKERFTKRSAIYEKNEFYKSVIKVLRIMKVINVT
ncbi:DNA/RNA helicase domain-containing protein [Bacillus sp. T3]|uniref:DNA/RNA helicase domain-containing protein n=1 Tax=Bacillus sp. T3 TaxID=467262 RepID=UPI003992DDA7